MVSMHSVAVILFLVDISTFGITALPVITLTLFYLFNSILSAAIQDGYSEISDSLYASNWYWMPKAERKMMWQVMLVAQQSKSFSVGIFGDSNLERFTDVKTLS